jgi:hypothetical protein
MMINEPLENVVSPPLEPVQERPHGPARKTFDLLHDLAPRVRADGQGGVDVMTLRSELEQTSRQWVTMVRMLEQQNDNLASVENTRDDEMGRLRELVAVIERSVGDVKTAMDTYRKGAPLQDVDTLFDITTGVLGELEKLSWDLSATMLACRTAWADYVRVVEDGKKLRVVID